MLPIDQCEFFPHAVSSQWASIVAVYVLAASVASVLFTVSMCVPAALYTVKLTLLKQLLMLQQCASK